MVRVKHRYLVATFLYPGAPEKTSSKDSLPDVLQFNQPSSDELDAKLLLRAIREGISELFGDYGAGVVSGSLKINYLSPATSTAIIRSPRAHYQLVWAALTFMTQLPQPIGQPCVVRVVRVSGTIRKSEDEIIRRAKAIIQRAQEAGSGVDDIVMAVGMSNSTRVQAQAQARREEDVMVVVDEDDAEETDSDG